jgi:hypothetical protein
MNPADLLFDRTFELHWQMHHCERLLLISLLQHIKPRLSIEIGTYKCGSLQAIAEHSEKVISVDVNPDLAAQFGDRFPNVQFVAGDSKETLPGIVEQLNAEHRSPEFVLIDGDHSTDGVRMDINLILGIEPQKPMIIVMHDGFNPDCRRGMLDANWYENPHVQSVDLDFVPGLFSPDAYDTAEAGSMWGGFACAVLTPERRQGPLIIQQRMSKVVDAVRLISVHNTKRAVPEHISLYKRMRRMGSALKKRFR